MSQSDVMGRPADPARARTVRLARPGDGAAVVEVANSRREAGGWADVRPLGGALDQVGGQIAIPDLPGATGWCFAALDGAELVGMLYACTPVTAAVLCGREAREAIVRTVAEVEIVAVAAHAQHRGVGTALLGYAEQYLRARGIELFTAKVPALRGPLLRWWRHRGWALARDGEACYLDARGRVGLDDGRDGDWRLAVHAPGRDLARGASGLWVRPALVGA